MEVTKLNERNYDIYVLCYNDKNREKRMVKRFEETGVPVNICSFKLNDYRVKKLLDLDQNPNTAFCCFFNHLAMMEEFYYHSDKEYGVFLENDIYLKKSLCKDLKNACNTMKILNLDVLLVGYLINNQPEVFGCHNIYNDIYGNKYYCYNNELWGTQGFILTRKQANYYINKYTLDYILSPNMNETISADWIYTKQGNRALMYPPLVVEEGIISDKENQIQINFHKNCKEFLYNSLYTS